MFDFSFCYFPLMLLKEIIPSGLLPFLWWGGGGAGRAAFFLLPKLLELLAHVTRSFPYIGEDAAAPPRMLLSSIQILHFHLLCEK